MHHVSNNYDIRMNNEVNKRYRNPTLSLSLYKSFNFQENKNVTTCFTYGDYSFNSSHKKYVSYHIRLLYIHA